MFIILDPQIPFSCSNFIIFPHFSQISCKCNNMGCINSKHLLKSSSSPSKNDNSNRIQDDVDEKESPVVDRNSNGDSVNLKVERRLVEAEHVAAGWPSWLTEVAGEAVHGWLPMKSGNFERLEKIGQGTYSSVYRARHTESGRMVALKKVRFNSLKPESVEFMCREITILRTLNHPNIMNLEGIITSQLSCSVYLVFEYMEHDLSGLLSCPDVKFNDSQIKCFMKQLLNGIEHCHSLGVLHRDIKTENILVNDEGVLKIGDFGLAKFQFPRNKEPLTSHVVTLWYRPPELLLGCTKYGTYVDMWSVGCVFAELFLGRPILKGGTEVEQLHKIFKLCGTPPDGYWNKSQLPLATMFRPHHAYESTLHERCQELPKTAVDLIETFLSLEPSKRGTARSALDSEYFNTKPYACDPTSLPKYLPNREIHAKIREETRRKKAGGVIGTARNPTRVRKTFQEQISFSKVVPTEVNADSQTSKRSQSDGICALPAQATTSSGGFKWATTRWKYVGNPTHRMPEYSESTNRVCNGFRNTGSFDSSEVHKSKDLPIEDHVQETFSTPNADLISQNQRCLRARNL